MSFYSLLFALGLYAAFGSPTPDNPGWVEIAVGALLLISAGTAGLAGIFKFHDRPVWFTAGQGLLIYGLTVGLLGGAIQGHDPLSITRDIIPFFFLLLPLFFWPMLRRQGGDALFIGILIIGGGFSLRVIFGFDAQALYYLGNSPCVLFAALFAIGIAVSWLSQRLSPRNMIVCIGVLAFAALTVMPLVASLQRASLGAVGIYILLALIMAFLAMPRRSIAIIALSIPLLWMGIQAVEPVILELQTKTNLVGINMRLQEWQAVWNEISASSLTLLFGQGWGAAFANPAVADITVSYTHSLISAMMLKTGLLGVIFTGVYLAALGQLAAQNLTAKPLIYLAIAAPLLIDIFLYAAYKSLDFGLVLALIPALGVAYGKLAFHDKLVYTKS